MSTLFESYMEYVENTEPPLIFHRWSLLSCIGAHLGRQFWFQHGEFRIFPNTYVMLMGDPGTRKSTAIKLAKRMIGAAGYDKFSGDRTSKEKFLLDLEGITSDDGKVINPKGVMDSLFGEGNQEPKEVFVCADEFNDFVGNGNIEFLSLLGNLWDWDDELRPFTQRLKTSKSVSIYQPTISILAGNTQTGFALAFPPATIGQGFLSRLLLIHGESSGKKITFPERPSEELRNRVVDFFAAMKSEVQGPATLSKKAREMLEPIYRTYQGLDDVRFQHYSTRRFTHLMKLCLLTAASRLSTEVNAEDVLFANTLLAFVEHKMPLAIGEFGKAKDADVSGRILTVLNTATRPLTVNDLWRHVSSDLENVQRLNQILQGLLAATKVQWYSDTAGNGGYMIKKKLLNKGQIYVDYDLLKEAKMK